MAKKRAKKSKTKSPEAEADPGPAVRVRYGDDETGWAFALPDGTYQIANIPLTDGLNLGDRVRCSAEGPDGRPRVLEVLGHKFAKKTFVTFATTAHLRTLADELLKAGAEIEPGIAPRAGKPGMVAISHPESVWVPEFILRLKLGRYVRVLAGAITNSDPPEAADAQEP